MLTRLLRALCRRHQRFAPHQVRCLIDAETSSGQQGHVNESALARLFDMHGLRLFSSGRWSLRPMELSQAIDGTRGSFRMVHLIRPPLEVVVSSYLYHLTTAEPWAHVRNPAWAIYLHPPLPPGASFATHLQSLSRQDGVLFQAQHSLRLIAQMVALAEACARWKPPKCTNIWLGAFASDFDLAAQSVLRALGLWTDRWTDGGKQRWAGLQDRDGRTSHHATGDKSEQNDMRVLLSALRRAAFLSPSKRKHSPHVTQGRSREHDAAREVLVQIVANSTAFGPTLRRLHLRLQSTVIGVGDDVEDGESSSGSAKRSPAKPAAVKTEAGSGRPRCVWRLGPNPQQQGWWSSAERTRVIVGNSIATNASVASSREWRVEGGASQWHLTPKACCELCRAAVDPGCLFFNFRGGRGQTSGHASGPKIDPPSGGTTPLPAHHASWMRQPPPWPTQPARARCTLLSSRQTFHRSRSAVTGEA